MIQIQRRYIRWALWQPLLIAALYIILPQCFSQQVILVNARDTTVENLTLWLQPNQQEAKPLWRGHLPAQFTVFLGFDPGYGHYTQRLASEDASVDIEFGYFTHSTRNIVVIGRNEADAFYLNNVACALLHGRFHQLPDQPGHRPDPKPGLPTMVGTRHTSLAEANPQAKSGASHRRKPMALSLASSIHQVSSRPRS